MQVLSCAESSRTSIGRSNVSLLDGSYLDLAASQQPRVCRNCRGERPPHPVCGDPSPSPRCAAASSPAGRAASRQAAERREPHSKSNRGCQRCRRCSQGVRRRRCERCDDAGLESSRAPAPFQRYVTDRDTTEPSSSSRANEQISGN